MPTPIISKFISYCEAELDLHDKLIVQKLTDPNETFYKSLPICIIDAVFSIGVKYQSVEKAEKHLLSILISIFRKSIPLSMNTQSMILLEI